MLPVLAIGTPRRNARSDKTQVCADGGYTMQWRNSSLEVWCPELRVHLRGQEPGPGRHFLVRWKDLEPGQDFGLTRIHPVRDDLAGLRIHAHAATERAWTSKQTLVRSNMAGTSKISIVAPPARQVAGNPRQALKKRF